MNKFVYILIASIVPFAAIAHDAPGKAHYLGNEGVMVEHEDTKILFDAFYAQSYGQYALVPDAISDAMLNGTAPYGGIDAIFVSHVHGDHFTADPAITYMRAHPDVHLYGSDQVKAAIMETGIDDNDPLLSRIHSVGLTPEDLAETFEIGSISIDVVAIPHAGNRPTIQNLVWRVTLDEETTVMHMGDAGPVIEDFERHRAHFAERDADMAFPPYWFLGHDEGEEIMSDIIKAYHVIGVHVPASAAENPESWREKHGGDLFTTPGEIRVIRPD